MILARSMAPGWLSNTWLVGDRPGGHAVLVDTGGPMEPIVQAIDERVFTGDTLFRGTVGGTRGIGHTDFEDLRHSILDVLLALPRDTVVHPGHMEETTIGREADDNPFVQAFRNPLPVGQPCTALGEPAELLLRAPDYDGGTKAWVRFADGRLDVVAGSRVHQ